MSSTQETTGSKDQGLPSVPTQDLLDLDCALYGLLQDDGPLDQELPDSSHLRLQDVSTRLDASSAEDGRAQVPSVDAESPPSKPSSTTLPSTSSKALRQHSSVSPSTALPTSKFDSRMPVYRNIPDPNAWFTRVRHGRKSPILSHSCLVSLYLS